MPELPTARKRWGQNYLQDPGVLHRMRRAIEPQGSDRFLEIGAGTGALTRQLLPACECLHALEIDPRMAGHLDPLAEKYSQFSWEVGDILEWRPAGAERDLRLVGNIPYYITSPILILAMEQRDHLRDAHLLMQKEVARRLVASPGTKEYGILSVYAELFARTELLFTVSRSVFVPKPTVDSAFVRLRFSGDALPSVKDEDFLRRVIRTAFNQRRKTLRNSLRSLLPDPLPTNIPFDLSARPEQLRPLQFVELAGVLKDEC